MDILPFLLLPLAGPEELSEEENEGNGSPFNTNELQHDNIQTVTEE